MADINLIALDPLVTFEAHDLVWLKNGTLERQRAWARDLPDWALSELKLNNPLIVRRAPTTPDKIPVGIRGRQRSQRYATFIPYAEVARKVRPTALRTCSVHPDRIFLPSLTAWGKLRSQASDVPYPWGPAGSCAYELATQSDWVTQTSDLDIVVYIDRPISRSEAKGLLKVFGSDACRTDVQVVTPKGGMALIEWARESEYILLKTNHGPILTNKPWGSEK